MQRISHATGSIVRWWRHQHPLVWVLSALVLVEFAALAAPRIVALTHSSRNELRAYAERVIEACRSAPFAPSCYDEEIPKLMDTISMEDAFEVTRIVQESDPRYRYCHVLGHNLSYREAGRNLDAWKDVITRCPTTLCNNGCLHGALMRRFNTETLTDTQIEALKPDLAGVCEPRGNWNPVEVERSMCYHAIGHLAMYVTGADMAKSVALCGQVGQKPDGRSYVQTCTEGVFMQVFQPLEPEDEALVAGIAPGRSEVAGFCKPFIGDQWQACRREAWPFFRDEIFDPAGLVHFCGYATDPAGARACYSTVLNMVTVRFLIEERDPGNAEKYCVSLPSRERQNQCFANMATRLIQIDPRYAEDAISFCERGERVGSGEECFRDLVHFAAVSFHPRTPPFSDYCRRFPEPHRRNCMALQNS